MFGKKSEQEQKLSKYLDCLKNYDVEEAVRIAESAKKLKNGIKQEEEQEQKKDIRERETKEISLEKIKIVKEKNVPTKSFFLQKLLQSYRVWENSLIDLKENKKTSQLEKQKASKAFKDWQLMLSHLCIDKMQDLNSEKKELLKKALFAFNNWQMDRVEGYHATLTKTVFFSDPEKNIFWQECLGALPKKQQYRLKEILVLAILESQGVKILEDLDFLSFKILFAKNLEIDSCEIWNFALIWKRYSENSVRIRKESYLIGTWEKEYCNQSMKEIDVDHLIKALESYNLVYSHKKIPPTAFDLLRLIRDNLKLFKGDLFPSLCWISEKMKRSQDAINRAKNILKRYRILSWRRRYISLPEMRGKKGPQLYQTSNVYRLMMPNFLKPYLKRFVRFVKGKEKFDFAWNALFERLQNKFPIVLPIHVEEMSFLGSGIFKNRDRVRTLKF